MKTPRSVDSEFFKSVAERHLGLAKISGEESIVRGQLCIVELLRHNQNCTNLAKKEGRHSMLLTSLP